MRYLTLAADYGEVSLRDELDGAQRPTELGLSSDLVADITAWNERYQSVIPADVDQRGADPMAALIVELDQAGIELTGRIADALGAGAKVRYYSEGLLREVT
jgi:hypothetical protein